MSFIIDNKTFINYYCHQSPGTAPPQSCHALLLLALLVNTYVPMSDFLGLPGVAKVIVSCAVTFMPTFFAGMIFAAVFRDSRQPNVDFGSNIGWVILGGLTEYVSLIVGFNYLLTIAILYYLLSIILKPRLQLVPTVASRAI